MVGLGCVCCQPWQLSAGLGYQSPHRAWGWLCSQAGIPVRCLRDTLSTKAGVGASTSCSHQSVPAQLEVTGGTFCWSRGGKPRPVLLPGYWAGGLGWAHLPGCAAAAAAAAKLEIHLQWENRRQNLKYWVVGWLVGCFTKKRQLPAGLGECRGSSRSPWHFPCWEEGVPCTQHRRGWCSQGESARAAGAPEQAGLGSSSSSFASWHCCEGHSGWNNSPGHCQAGARQRSENFLTVTNACPKTMCVYLSVVRSISLSSGKAVSLLQQSPLPFEPPLLRKRLDNVLL